MGLLSRWFREAVMLNVQHRRRCPDCGGAKWKPDILRAPDGTVPLRKVVAKIQCGRCKGRGDLLIAEQTRERVRGVVVERSRVYEGR